MLLRDGERRRAENEIGKLPTGGKGEEERKRSFFLGFFF